METGLLLTIKSEPNFLTIKGSVGSFVPLIFLSKNGLKRMAGSDESLQNNLDSILHDDISINSLARQAGKVVDAMQQDDSDSEDHSGEEDPSSKMV